VKLHLPFFLMVCALLGLIACGGQTPTVNPENSLPISRVDGAATLVRVAGRGEGALLDSATLVPRDEIRAETDGSVTIQVSDGNTLHLEADSSLTLLWLRSSNRHPVFQLQTGAVDTSLPPPTDKPEPRPKNTNPPQPTNPPPPPPTEPPPTREPPTPRPTVGG
jgi:hypothetical protein